MAHYTLLDTPRGSYTRVVCSCVAMAYPAPVTADRCRDCVSFTQRPRPGPGPS